MNGSQGGWRQATLSVTLLSEIATDLRFPKRSGHGIKTKYKTWNGG